MIYRPAVLTICSMFFQLLFIHLFRPFLKYTQATSPLPQTVSPRKLCTQAAAMISKLMRLYKRSHGLRQICNIAVYIVHSACTIHMLNLPDKNARRDIVHGVKHLEEIAEGWLCARRTLGILSVLARKWSVELPEEAAAVLTRTDAKFGRYSAEIPSPSNAQRRESQATMNPSQFAAHAAWQNPATIPTASGYFNHAPVPTAATAFNSGGAAQPTGTTNGVRKPSTSSDYALPPQDANGLRAQQYPSATTTPAGASAQSRQRSRESIGAKSGGSPSDMFGGVEQLIRDSQDWVYRDQAQFAMGFENWGGLGVDVDPSTWTNGGLGEGGVNGGAVGGGLNGLGGAMPNGSAPYATNGVSAVSANNAFPPATGTTNWMSANPYDSMVAAYNEDEWYQ